MYTVYYLHHRSKTIIDYSPQPGLDFQRRSGEGLCLSPPLPAYLAEELAESLKKYKGKERIIGGARRWLRARDLPLVVSQGVDLTPPPLVREIPQLQGRLLLPEETGRPEEELHWLYLQGKLQRQPAVQVDCWGEGTCRRCGTVDLPRSFCPHCGRTDCYYCGECATMGTIRSCTLLYYAPPPAMASFQVKPHLEFALTEPQIQASRQLADFVARDSRRECLLWAVCGAGKTEASFAAAAEALAQGGRVLYAIPRREIVRELIPRFRKAFPGLDIAAYYGGAPKPPGLAPLVIATTHQTLRFYQTFDLVILDEADAYPYRGSRMLAYALHRAAKPGGKIISMTATPDPGSLRRARWGLGKLVTIPARHHGYPLPEPQLKKLPLSLQPLKIPPSLAQQVAGYLAAAHPLLIFVPTIAAAEGLCSLLPRGKVGYTHSQDPEKDRKRRLVEEGGVLVSTSLLERGITIPRVDVMVLFADHPLFDVGTLIQMAGRSGRSSEAPRGRVWFYGRRITAPMRQARAMIRELNRRARRGGFLIEDQKNSR
ncbi:MAG: DEAD/DEAH box helicase [Limnochordia bacterium]